MQSKKVVFLRLQTSTGFNVPGVGEIGNSIPPSGKTLRNLDMYTSEEGVVCNFNDTQSGKLPISVVVPYANIVFMRLSTEKPKDAN